MSQFSFPVLENDELLQCLEEMEVSMDSTQLAKPTYDCVRAIFEQIVILLTGTTRCMHEDHTHHPMNTCTMTHACASPARTP